MANPHENYMKLALREAQKAADRDEVPVGAVIVRDGKIISRAFNRRETDHNPCAHAELLAIWKAAKKLGGWRLTRCQLYVTLEPCPMCAGAILNSRIEAVYFGARDPKAGCFGSLCDLNALPFNHHPLIWGGILEPECAQILKSYFQQKRRIKKEQKKEE